MTERERERERERDRQTDRQTERGVRERERVRQTDSTRVHASNTHRQRGARQFGIAELHESPKTGTHWAQLRSCVKVEVPLLTSLTPYR